MTVICHLFWLKGKGFFSIFVKVFVHCLCGVIWHVQLGGSGGRWVVKIFVLRCYRSPKQSSLHSEEKKKKKKKILFLGIVSHFISNGSSSLAHYWLRHKAGALSLLLIFAGALSLPREHTHPVGVCVRRCGVRHSPGAWQTLGNMYILLSYCN